MSDRQVTCTKKDGADADRRIDRLGGPGFNEHIDTVIGHIERGIHTYYVIAQGRRVAVIVKTHPTSGRKYLTTEGDGFPPNNLLQLPDCPR